MCYAPRPQRPTARFNFDFIVQTAFEAVAFWQATVRHGHTLTCRWMEARLRAAVASQPCGSFLSNDDAVSCGRARQWDSTDANGDREAMHDGRK